MFPSPHTGRGRADDYGRGEGARPDCSTQYSALSAQQLPAKIRRPPPICPFPTTPTARWPTWPAFATDRPGIGADAHPERHLDPTHHPRWTRGEAGPVGDGLQLFTNAVRISSDLAWENILDLFTNPKIIAEINRAWRESRTDDQAGRHEEGGYIVLNPDRSAGVERWPRGEKFRITPRHWTPTIAIMEKWLSPRFIHTRTRLLTRMGRNGNKARANRIGAGTRVRNLPGFVISRMLVYDIDSTGNVSVVGRRDEVLSL